MGAAPASNGTFFVGADFIWVGLSGNAGIKNPEAVLPGTTADVSLREAIATGVGGLHFPIGPPKLELYVIAGLRWYGTKATLTLANPFIGFSPSESLRKDWLNPLVGMTAKYQLDPKWFVNTEADIGGWSDSATGQALAPSATTGPPISRRRSAIASSTLTKSKARQPAASGYSNGCTVRSWR